MKYANYIILLLLLLSASVFRDNIQLSSNLLSLFASKESVERLDIATDLGYTKEMLVAVKGFESSSKRTVDELSKKFKELDGIELVESKVSPSKEIQDYYRKFYPLLAEFDKKEQDSKSVNAKLQELYNAQSSSFFYTPIDKNDPLKLFSFESGKNLNLASRGGYITLGDYGYLIRIKTDVSPSQMSEAKRLYKNVKEIIGENEDVIAFAGFFYTVENSAKIKEDITLIVVLSTILLLVMYVVLLKNIRLLLNTIVALFSSMVFAVLISTQVYENFHVMSLAFGMSVTAVSIDYLFHYYFHNFYHNKNRIDKSVLYGYLTTTAAFAIFSFIPVPLIAQISFFTALSLSFAYFTFTFVFPYLNLRGYRVEIKEEKSFKAVPSYVFSTISIALLIYTALNINFDNNIRNLDYQNDKLKEVESIFKNSQKSNYYPVIVEAKNKDELITNLHTLHKDLSASFSLASFVPDKQECLRKREVLESYDFDRLNRLVNEEADNIGFKDGYFSSSYDMKSNIPSCDSIDLDIFKSYNLSITLRNGSYYTMALIKDMQSASRYDFVSSIDVKAMFERVSKQMFDDIFVYSLTVMSVIIFLIILSVRRRFFYAINYILFPLGLVLAVLVTFFEINIMHIFSLIILISIGIDYGIYMSNSNKPANTMLAIKYSLLSTFAAFGVLVFSSITALNSIGLVISLGVGAIFILIKVMR